MGQNPKAGGSKFRSRRTEPENLDPNLSLPLSLSLFATCLRFILNVVSLGSDNSKPRRNAFQFYQT